MIQIGSLNDFAPFWKLRICRIFNWWFAKFFLGSYLNVKQEFSLDSKLFTGLYYCACTIILTFPLGWSWPWWFWQLQHIKFCHVVFHPLEAVLAITKTVSSNLFFSWKYLNPFHATVLFLNPLKRSENLYLKCVHTYKYILS